jgi:nucleotide-binding universal stress UspA family protein
MEAHKRILIAIDDSEASRRAVAYVGRMIGGRKGFRIRLFHVLAPLPSTLEEFVGGENRQREEPARAEWVARGEKAGKPVFARAKAILRMARIPAHAVETQLATWDSDQGLAAIILEAARTSQCGTIVVGRESFAGLREVFQRHVHVADELLPKAQGFALWVVE